jgi:serine/threonine kinase 16
MSRKQKYEGEIIKFANITIKIMKKLGEGGFAVVYLVKDIKTNELYALKRINTHKTEQIKEIENEILLMDSFSHPNILKLIDYIITDSDNNIITTNITTSTSPNTSFLTNSTRTYSILLEYCNNTLVSLMNSVYSTAVRIPDKKILNIFNDILMGIVYLHNKVYLCLKKKNIALIVICIALII